MFVDSLDEVKVVSLVAVRSSTSLQAAITMILLLRSANLGTHKGTYDNWDDNKLL
jgi:hypothetical protein